MPPPNGDGFILLPPPKGCDWMLLLNGVGDGATADEPNGVEDDNPNGDGAPIVPPKVGAVVDPTFDDPNGVCEVNGVTPPNGELLLLALFEDCPNSDVPVLDALKMDGADDDAPNGVGADPPLPKGVVVVGNGDGLVPVPVPKLVELNGDCC
jgi:hypothetical protein